MLCIGKCRRGTARLRAGTRAFPRRRIGEDRVARAAYLNLSDGEWTAADSGAAYPVIEPASGTKLADVPKGGEEDARAAIDAARAAFDKGRGPPMTPGGRG